jgi:hypothetical protein
MLPGSGVVPVELLSAGGRNNYFTLARVRDGSRLLRRRETERGAAALQQRRKLAAAQLGVDLHRDRPPRGGSVDSRLLSD